MKVEQTIGVEALEGRAMLTAVVGLLAGNEVVVFDSAAPEQILARRQLRMPAGEKLVGVDYGAGQFLIGISETWRFYRIDLGTGRVRLSADPAAPAGAGGPMTFDMSVQRDGADFRAVASGGRQFAGRMDAPAEVSAVGYVPGDVNAGARPDVVGLAHLRGPGLGLEGETVYGIDARTDALVTVGTFGGRRSADTGRLYTVGGLGVDFGRVSGFDVVTDPYGVQLGFASTVRDGRTVFCTVDLRTGAATDVGEVGGGAVVRDITVLSGAGTALGVTVGNQLLVFDAVSADVVFGRTAVTGLRADESILSMDVRPGTGELFAVSSRDVLYRVDLPDGVARPVGARFTPFFKGAPASADFDPVSGQLRVLSDRGEMLRLDPETGAVIDARPFKRGVQIDPPLHVAGTGAVATGVVTMAHINNFRGTAGTRLFGIDAGAQRLVEVIDRGADVVGEVTAPQVAIGDVASLDVVSGPRGDVAFLAVRRPGQQVVEMYQFDVRYGTAVFGAPIASGSEPVRDIAIMTG